MNTQTQLLLLIYHQVEINSYKYIKYIKYMKYKKYKKKKYIKNIKCMKYHV